MRREKSCERLASESSINYYFYGLAEQIIQVSVSSSGRGGEGGLVGAFGAWDTLTLIQQYTRYIRISTFQFLKIYERN